MKKKTYILVTILMTMIMIIGATFTVCAAENDETVLVRAVALDGVTLTITSPVYQQHPGSKYDDFEVNVVVTNTSGNAINSPSIHNAKIIEADEAGGFIRSKYKNNNPNKVVVWENGESKEIQFVIPNTHGINTISGLFRYYNNKTGKLHKTNSFIMTGWKNGDVYFVVPATEETRAQAALEAQAAQAALGQ